MEFFFLNVWTDSFSSPRFVTLCPSNTILVLELDNLRELMINYLLSCPINSISPFSSVRFLTDLSLSLVTTTLFSS
jgi:hypothetical protein